jgi:hypothetical protein
MPVRMWEDWRGGKLRGVTTMADDKALDRLTHGWDLRKPQPTTTEGESSMTTSKRVTFSHADCKHESTSKARAACRAARAEAAAKQAAASKPKAAPKKRTTTTKAEATAAA